MRIIANFFECVLNMFTNIADSAPTFWIVLALILLVTLAMIGVNKAAWHFREKKFIRILMIPLLVVAKIALFVIMLVLVVEMVICVIGGESVPDFQPIGQFAEDMKVLFG